MHTIPHTLIRDGKYLYNRRVPVKAQNRYGKLIRFRIGSEMLGVTSSLLAGAAAGCSICGATVS